MPDSPSLPAIRERQTPAQAGLPPIPREELPRLIGQPIHLAWAQVGCVWILERIDGETMHLRTPKTGRRRTEHVSAACHTRKQMAEPW